MDGKLYQYRTDEPSGGVELSRRFKRQAKEITMKNLKLLGLAAMAAMALMAVAASSASATGLYNGTTKLWEGSTIDFSIPSGGSTKLVDTNGGTLDQCLTGTIKSTILGAGGVVSGTTVDNLYAVKGGWNIGLTWGGCSFPTTTTTPGKLKVNWTKETQGTVESDAEIGVTINTVLFGSCVYGVAENTSLGTLTTASSGAATFDANAVAKRLSGSQAACPETSKWTGSYTSTEPVNLRVEKE